MKQKSSVRTLIKVRDSQDDVINLKTQASEIKSSIDAVNKTITDKIWQTDIDESINLFDNTSIKNIRDTVTEHQLSIGKITDKVSDVESVIKTKADGSTVTELTDRVALAEQTADGFKQTVESTYSTKDEVNSLESEFTQRADIIEQNVKTNTGNITNVAITANGVQTEVINARGDKANLKIKVDEMVSDISSADGKASTAIQTANEIKTTLSQKQDIGLTSIRYIRDWLNGNSVNTGNHWVECKVMIGETNLTEGLSPVCKNDSLDTVTAINSSYYTDGLLSNPNNYTSTPSGRFCLQLDLGEVRNDIDYIQIWHYYGDNRIYNHQLQVSKDGTSWVTLYDSLVSGGYAESKDGATYYISQSSIVTNFSVVKQKVDEVSSTVARVDGNLTEVKQTADRIDQSVSSSKELITQIDEKIIGLNKDFVKENTDKGKQIAQIITDVSGITNRVAKVEGDVTDISDIRLDASGWKALFAQLDMYDMPNIQTNISLDVNGITVNNPKTGQETRITIDEFAGYNNKEKIFFLSQDMTVTKQIFIQNGWDTGTVKMTTSSFTDKSGRAVKGVAYVKSLTSDPFLNS